MLRMICDDQKSELETVQKLLEDYAGEHPDLFLSIRCFSNPLDMLDEMDRSGAPDIALLDICMLAFWARTSRGKSSAKAKTPPTSSS